MLIFVNRGNVAYISLIGGALTEFISAVNFYLYGRASNQLETFHIRLDKTQLIILADSVCEGLCEDMKSQTRADLVAAIANSLVINTVPELQVPKRKASKAKVATKSQQTKDSKAQDEG